MGGRLRVFRTWDFTWGNVVVVSPNKRSRDLWRRRVNCSKLGTNKFSLQGGKLVSDIVGLDLWVLLISLGRGFGLATGSVGDRGRLGVKNGYFMGVACIFRP